MAPEPRLQPGLNIDSAKPAEVPATAIRVQRRVPVVAQSDEGRALLAELVWARTSKAIAELGQQALTGRVGVALSLDPGLAFRIVRFGNGLEPALAARLAQSLVDVAGTAGDTVGPAIELALAQDGGNTARLAGALRGEPAVAANPDAPEAPLNPIVAPAGIGGDGTTGGSVEDGGTDITTILARNTAGSGPVVPGPLFPPPPGPDVSP